LITVFFFFFRFSICVIISDSKCEVLVTFFEHKDHIIALEIAKAMAALKAVNFNHKLSFYKVILEGDALQMVHALRKEDSNWCIYDHLIEETMGALHSMQSWKVHHLRHNLNDAAHRLVNVALSLSEAHVCLEETPHCIFDIIVVKRCT